MNTLLIATTSICHRIYDGKIEPEIEAVFTVCKHQPKLDGPDIVFMRELCNICFRLKPQTARKLAARLLEGVDEAEAEMARLTLAPSDKE